MASRVVTISKGPQTLTSIACDRLRQEIIKAVLLPGQKIHIAQLCERYSMGLSPVREALNRLSRDGLVIQTDRRGFYVAPLSHQYLEELTKTRSWLNALGLRESIANGDEAWEEGVVVAYHRLSKIPRYLSNNGAAGVNDRWEDAHRKFHASLISGCGSSWLIRYCEQLFDAADRYRHLSRLSRNKNDGQIRDEHREMMEAIVARDTDSAVHLLNHHFARTADLVQKNLKMNTDKTNFGEHVANSSVRTQAKGKR